MSLPASGGWIPAACSRNWGTQVVNQPLTVYTGIDTASRSINVHRRLQHCRKWHYEAESLMTFISTMGPKGLIVSCEASCVLYVCTSIPIRSILFLPNAPLLCGIAEQNCFTLDPAQLCQCWCNRSCVCVHHKNLERAICFSHRKKAVSACGIENQEVVIFSFMYYPALCSSATQLAFMAITVC